VEAFVAAIEAIAIDRVHGGGYLARRALGVLALAPPELRSELASRLANVRPEMPAISSAVTEAVNTGDIRATIRRADAERRRVARAAARSFHRRPVATMSNSSLVARALVYGGPSRTQVVVAGPDDEGWYLVADLRTAGLEVEVVGLDQLDAELAVVGCEAVFADGTFVARRGTRALVDRLPTLVLVDRWKRLDTMPPSRWPSSDRFEMIPGDEVRAPA
jgi:hypothetical protein